VDGGRPNVLEFGHACAMHLPVSGALRDQCGVATVRQLEADGLSRGELRAQLDGGRWRALNELVVVSHNGPLSPEQQRWAAYLSVQGLAATCAWTALEQWRVTRFESADVHLLVPRGARPMPADGVNIVLHESRRFTERDVVYGRSPPATRLARAAVDAAAWSPDVWTAFRVFVAPVQQRRELASAMRAELLRAGRVRYCRQLRALAADLCAGADALSEVEFIRFCRRHGLPKPRCQRRMDRGGRWRYLDAELVGPDGRIVSVEIDGGVHLLLSVRAEDTLKDNDAILDRKLVLRYTSASIYADDPRAVAQLRRALGLVRSTGGYSHRTF
jgi:hypothetical protein